MYLCITLGASDPAYLYCTRTLALVAPLTCTVHVLWHLRPDYLYMYMYFGTCGNACWHHLMASLEGTPPVWTGRRPARLDASMPLFAFVHELSPFLFKPWHSGIGIRASAFGHRQEQHAGPEHVLTDVLHVTLLTCRSGTLGPSM